MEDLIGRASAATLGFISGNSRGAYLADKAFRTYRQKTKQMANGRSRSTSSSVSRGRRSTPITPVSNPRKRSRSTVSLGSSSSRSTMRGNPFTVSNKLTNAVHSGDAKQGGFKISGPRTSKAKKKDKVVKITRNFKKKVDAALTKSNPTGYYQERYYQKFKPEDFRQVIADLGGGNYLGQFGLSNSTLHFFDPIRVIDAASVLFNNKAPVGTNKTLADANNFDPLSFECEVTRQWVEINIKNNSARNIEVRLWTWELKKPQVNNGSAANFGTEWIASFAREASATDGKINQLSIGADTIGASPSMSPAMRERFAIEEKIILLEAGKYFKHTIQGPRKKYNFPSFGLASGFNNAQKGNKGVCMAIMVDNTSTSTFGAGNSGRVTDIAAADGFGILTETIYNYVIKVPDQAGFQYPASTALGTMQTLKQKRHGPYAIQIWNNPGAATIGPVTEVPDEAPLNQGAVGV